MEPLIKKEEKEELINKFNDLLKSIFLDKNERLIGKEIKEKSDAIKKIEKISKEMISFELKPSNE